jgi:hypothetical protein
MSNQFKHPWLVIIVPILDEPLHTAENNYRCGDIQCPCHDGDTVKTLAAYFQAHPGEYAKLHHGLGMRKTTAKLGDETPTEILQPAPKNFDTLIKNEPVSDQGTSTWRFPRFMRRGRSR